MKTYMFPGQGSQARGMGAALFGEFKDITRAADEILGYSIKELCLEDPRGELNKTQYTQPAMYVVNALSYFKKIAEAGKPDYVTGHSLGELNALLAAECFSFEAGLRIVQKRSQLMGLVSNGAMAAIVNASKSEIEAILAANGLGNIDLANYNTPSQIVISGAQDEIAKAEPLFQQGKMRYYPLNTSGAFHSRFMRAAGEEFRAYLGELKFSAPKIPVISNVTARPYEHDEITENLARQMTSTVRWSESIQYLMGLGSGSNEMLFEEVGHGDVLTRIYFTIKQQTVSISTPAGQSSVQASRSAGPPPRNHSAAAQAVSGTAEEKVLAWNAKHPIGTKVKSHTFEYDELETRTAALVLFGHRAAVYMKGYNGYFDLDEIAPA